MRSQARLDSPPPLAAGQQFKVHPLCFHLFGARNLILHYPEYSTKVATGVGSPLSFTPSPLGGTVKQEIQLSPEAVLT